MDPASTKHECDKPLEQVADRTPLSWINRYAPAPLIPYLKLVRADRPIGVWLLLFPCLWGLALASGGFPDPWLVLLFVTGSMIMRGAGCVINDIADRNYDARVERTKGRPIASGAISVPKALAFLALLLAAGLAVLLAFNQTTIMVALASLPLIVAYPFMKRITYWPQAFLGVTFNWGALLGWTAVTGGLALAPAALYAGCIAWTLGYDTVYAHQDKADDIRAGVKSTALRLGTRTRPWIFGFYGVAVMLFGLSGWLGDAGLPFAAGLAAATIHLLWQAGTVNFDDPADCLAKFTSNSWVGALLLTGIVADRLLG
jgi:4-hydroxybenzoate polyprenyltransferase